MTICNCDLGGRGGEHDPVCQNHPLIFRERIEETCRALGLTALLRPELASALTPELLGQLQLLDVKLEPGQLVRAPEPLEVLVPAAIPNSYPPRRRALTREDLLRELDYAKANGCPKITLPLVDCELLLKGPP